MDLIQSYKENNNNNQLQEPSDSAPNPSPRTTSADHLLPDSSPICTSLPPNPPTQIPYLQNKHVFYNIGICNYLPPTFLLKKK